MGKLKTIPEDMIRCEVIPHKDPEKPPHITTYLNKYGTDHKGELMALGNLGGCGSRQEALLELGRVVLESSPNIQAWLTRKNLTD